MFRPITKKKILMLSLKLTISTTNEQLSVNVPTEWHDVSVLQFAQIQGKDVMEQIAVLLDLELKKVWSIDFPSLEILLDAMDFLTQPIPEPHKSDFPQNIGRESIGQLELAKKFVLALEDGNIWFMAPYIYAIYVWPERYDIEAAFASLSGFPSELVLEAQKVPITKMYNAILFFSLNSKGFATHLLPCLTVSPMLTKKSPASIALTSTASLPLS